MKRKGSKISDRELRALLGSLREEVAAPRGFSSGILARLDGAAAPVRPSLLDRLASLIPSGVPRFALGAAAALALALGAWIGLGPKAVTPAPGADLVPQTASRPVPAPQLASAPKVARPAASRDVRTASRPAVESGSGVMEGSASGAAAQGSSSAPVDSGASFSALADPKPTVIVIEPTPTLVVRSLENGSQVRRNKIRVADHEYMAVMVRLRKAGRVRVEAWDRLGAMQAVIFDGQQPSGVSEMRWYGHNERGESVGTGIYLIRVKTEEYEERHKAVVVR